jgi:hypothetical protein
MADMSGTKTIGDEKLDRLPDQLVARVTKDLLGLKVDELDLSVGAGNDHRVWRSIE